LDEPLTAKSEERNYSSELLRLRGELQLKIHQIELAERDFRESIALAQSTGAKSWELRSAVSLARLLRDITRHDEARTILREIYCWFTEGCDTKDLKEAKALLDELNQ
jgi:predicted ATPase